MTAHLAAVVLAAGLSRRMGQPKMTLPWGTTTVIGQVVKTLHEGGVTPVVVVTGGGRAAVEAALAQTAARCVFNPRHTDDSMLTSLQCGLAALDEAVAAALVVLGDQPQMEGATLNALRAAYHGAQTPLIVPSFQMRRGHPWLLDRSLWGEAERAAAAALTLRQFLQAQQAAIHYVTVESASVLQDLDTPEDYRQQTNSLASP